jgi:N-acetyl-beta-hexosaminidase
MVALEFGTSLDSMSEVQAKYMEKVKEKLQKRAEELRAEDEALEARLAQTLVLGKEAYE